MVFLLLLCGPSMLQADEDSEELFQDSDEIEIDEAFEHPDAVGADLSENALRFFFVAVHPTSKVYYYREGEEYRPIQAAFNTFGNMHRISPRLNFCSLTSSVLQSTVRGMWPMFLFLS